MSLIIKHPTSTEGTVEVSGLTFVDGVALVVSVDAAAREVLSDHGFTFEEIEDAEVVEIAAPDGSWTHEQIDEFAGRFEISLDGATKKDEKLALIAKAIEDRTAAAEATGALQ